MSNLTADDARHLLHQVAHDDDRDAMADLYRHFAPRVRAWLLRRGGSEQHVEEVVHEVMLTVWKQASRYDPERAAPSTWIFTIARNRHIDRLRRRSRPEPEPDDPDLVPKPRLAADLAASRRQRARHLQGALDELPPEQAQVIRRAWLDGLSLRQVAEEEGIPLGTVKSRSRLAFAALRKRLDGLEIR